MLAQSIAISVHHEKTRDTPSGVVWTASTSSFPELLQGANIETWTKQSRSFLKDAIKTVLEKRDEEPFRNPELARFHIPFHPFSESFRKEARPGFHSLPLGSGIERKPVPYEFDLNPTEFPLKPETGETHPRRANSALLTTASRAHLHHVSSRARARCCGSRADLRR